MARTPPGPLFYEVRYEESDEADDTELVMANE